MTQAPASDNLVLRSPDALLAALPYLLGFTPQESCVLVWLASGRIALTQRIDLPAIADQAWCDAVWSPAGVTSADELIVVAIGASGRADSAAAAVMAQARREGMPVRDCLRMDAGRWWSALCTDLRCCPTGGREIEPSTQLTVSAQMALEGLAPKGERSELVTEFAPSPVAMAEVELALGAVTAHRGQWRPRAVDRIVGWIAASDPVDPVDVADVLVGLADIRVRDTVLWDVSRMEADDLRNGLVRLAAAVRSAPGGRAAPVATCAAIVAWLLGDGARALITLQRALDDDPDYSLGVLVLRSVEVGLPPGTWREAMRGISRQECLG